jgi:hypothetical protein
MMDYYRILAFLTLWLMRMMAPMFIINITIGCVYNVVHAANMYIKQEEGCFLFSRSLPFSFAKWIKWPMGNWNQMVNEEQIMKRKGMMIASWVCTRELFLTQLEAAGIRIVISRTLLIVHFLFYLSFIYTRRFLFLCQSSSLYRSNTQVIRPYNLSIHLLVCV